MLINSVNSNKSSKNFGQKPFGQMEYFHVLSKPEQKVAKFLNLQETDGKLSYVRLVQEILTNWFPKALFARSIVDLSELTFLEFSEQSLVYLSPMFLGQMFRKLYEKKLPQNLRKEVATSASELIKSKNLNNKKLIPIKAAITVSALLIPLTEYSLSYIKNLFTLKLFKQADFNNIANLNKDKTENFQKQDKVRESAKRHIKYAGFTFAGCLGFAALLATKGKDSRILNSISEFILAPGSKLFKNNVKKAKIVNQYFGLDFASHNGKLAMSNGQITACATAALFGYGGAAKDRGKQNFKEVMFRLPLVVFYAVTGSSLLERGFKSYLSKKESYKNIIGKDLHVPKLSELGNVAKSLAVKNGTSAEAEFKRLFKQKATISGIPFLFGIGFMGFFVAGMSRYFTQYRYNKEKERELNHSKQFGSKTMEEFISR